MSLPDSAEYWWNARGYSPRDNEYPHRNEPHDCKPRGGCKGTPYRFNCAVCGKSFKDNPDWHRVLDGGEARPMTAGELRYESETGLKAREFPSERNTKEYVAWLEAYLPKEEQEDV